MPDACVVVAPPREDLGSRKHADLVHAKLFRYFVNRSVSATLSTEGVHAIKLQISAKRLGQIGEEGIDITRYPTCPRRSRGPNYQLMYFPNHRLEPARQGSKGYGAFLHIIGTTAGINNGLREVLHLFFTCFGSPDRVMVLQRFGRRYGPVACGWLCSVPMLTTYSCRTHVLVDITLLRRASWIAYARVLQKMIIQTYGHPKPWLEDLLRSWLSNVLETLAIVMNRVHRDAVLRGTLRAL